MPRVVPKSPAYNINDPQGSLIRIAKWYHRDLPVDQDQAVKLAMCRSGETGGDAVPSSSGSPYEGGRVTPLSSGRTMWPAGSGGGIWQESVNAAKQGSKKAKWKDAIPTAE